MVCYLLISISLLLHIRNYRLFWILYVSLLFQIMLLYFLNDYSLSNTFNIINITMTLTPIPIKNKPNPEAIVIINGGDPKAASELKVTLSNLGYQIKQIDQLRLQLLMVFLLCKILQQMFYFHKSSYLHFSIYQPC